MQFADYFVMAPDFVPVLRQEVAAQNCFYDFKLFLWVFFIFGCVLLENETR